jgi:very-short-patch-repair endonuclease
MATETTLNQDQLYCALLARGIPARLEHSDGHKHVDIGVPEAKLYIEVDGLRHLTDAEQLLRDIARDHYSDDEGNATIHVPNEFIESHLDEVADAIAQVAKKRMGRDH